MRVETPCVCICDRWQGWVSGVMLPCAVGHSVGGAGVSVPLGHQGGGGAVMSQGTWGVSWGVGLAVASGSQGWRFLGGL